MAMENEEKLIELARKGDQEAFMKIVNGYKKKIFYLLYDLTSSVQDAEDFAQDAFIKAWRSISNFRGDAKFGTWLHRIAINTFIDQKRKRSYNEAQSHESLEPHHQEEDSPQQSPEDFLERGEVQEHVEKALSRLSIRERAVFVMRHYQEKPVQEVSLILNVSTGTVKSLFFRGMKKIRQELAHHYNLSPKEQGGNPC